MTIPDPPLTQLRLRLKMILANGIPEEPLAHAEMMAEVTAVLYESFASVGIQSTLVGGGAIEIHAPGIYKSGDVDVVLEHLARATAKREEVFEGLGFSRRGRHWCIGDLFVETPPGPVSDPAELIRVKDLGFRIVTKETILADRVIGFKHWEELSYGQQTIDMLVAFGGALDREWLKNKLEGERSWDAFLALEKLAWSNKPVNEDVLRQMLSKLLGRKW